MREFAKFPTEDWLRRRVGELAFAMALGLAFAWIGPFSTDEAAFLPKLGYWVGLMACWFVLIGVTERWIMGLPAFGGLKPWLRRLVHAGFAALPMLFVTAPATMALKGFEPTALELSEMYSQIVVIGWGVLLLLDAITAPTEASAFRAAPEAIESPPAHAAPPLEIEDAAPQACRLMERLPPKLRGPLVCLEMEDHYVRVHTARGSTLILMRLGDAMVETAPVDGAQAHRSWWVAADAIETLERVGRTAQLRLKNGLTVPVSQKYLLSIETLAGVDRVA